MEGKRKLDFKKYVSAPVSKWYLARIAFYIIMLTGLIVLFFSQKDKKVVDVKKVYKIENLNILIEE